MADDPWGQFVVRPATTAPPDDPWAQFTPASSPADLGATALWNKPANVSWGDYMLAHLAKPFQGANQAANDYGRVASNALTFNQGDRLNSWLNGSSLPDERAASAAARDRLGMMAPIAEAATYALGPGELNVAGRLGGKVGGMMAEGALSGGLYGAGSANDVSQIPGAAVSGALGGTAGGAAGRLATRFLDPVVAAGATAIGRATGALDNPADVTAATKAARGAAYDELKNTPLDIGDTRQALQRVRDVVEKMDPTGGFQKNAPRSMAVLDNLQAHVTNNNAATAHDLVSLGLDKLRNIPDTAAAGGESELRPAIQQGIENFLESGPAAGQLKAARAAHQDYANAKALEDWSSGLRDFGASPAGAAQDVAQTFYSDPARKAQYDALANIANAGGGGQSAYGLMHAAHGPIDMAAAAAGLGHFAGPVGAAVSYGAFKPAASALLKRGQKAAVQNAISAAYPALTARTTAYQPDLSPAARALLFGGLGGHGF
jgi:hypothetical protein